MNSSATADDDVKAIRRLGEEFFAGVATADLDRRMATMDPDAIIMPPDRPSIVGAEEIVGSPTITPQSFKKNAAWFTMKLRLWDIGDSFGRL